MSKKPERQAFGAGYAALAATGALMLATALLFILGSTAIYKPFFLLALLLLLPAAVNLLLLLPLWLTKRARRKDAPADPEGELQTQKKRGIGAMFRRASVAVGGFFTHYRTALTTLVVVVAAISANIFFWRFAKAEYASTLLSFYMAVVLLVLSVLFVVLGKWCKHATPDTGKDEAQASAARYEVALMRNLQAASVMGALVTLLGAATVALRVLGVFDPSRVLVAVAAALMIYQTVFFGISLFVVLMRREMQVAPEIMAPVPGVRYGNLGVLDYLEKNTGISMRSLWSIRMIGRTIPYAFLFSVLLLWCATGIVMVGSDQQGAHYHFGKLGEEPLQPGLHMTLPWPFDEVKVYNTKTVEKMTVGYVTEKEGDNLWTEAHGAEEYRLLVGGGKELVSINLRVEYRIGDLYRYLTCTGAPELLMSASSYEIVTAHTIGADLDTLLSVDRTAFGNTFKEELMREMERFGTGLEVVSVVLESIHPPVEVAEAYQSLISAGIDADRLLLEAEAYAGERIEWAHVNFTTATALARIEQYEKVADAEAALAEFMASVEADNSNSDAYRYYKYLQALTGAYRGSKLIIVGDGVDQSNIYIGNIGG